MTAQELYALNRRIAEALGYRFEEQIDPLSRTPVTIIWRQDGAPFVVPPDGVFWDTDKGPEFRNWAGDTDAALELALAEDIIGVDINQAGGEVVALIRSDTRRATGYGDTYAEAVCRAWLVWKGE